MPRSFGIWIAPRNADEPGFLTTVSGNEVSYETFEAADYDLPSYQDDFHGVAWLSVRERPVAAGIDLTRVGNGYIGKRTREAA